MPRGLCPICREPFDDDARFRDHLGDVHGLTDDPGTESRLPGGEREDPAEHERGDTGGDSTDAGGAAAGMPAVDRVERPPVGTPPAAAAAPPEAVTEAPGAVAPAVPLELARTFEQLSFWPAPRPSAPAANATARLRHAVAALAPSRPPRPDLAALRARLTPERLRRARVGAAAAAGLIAIGLGAPALSGALGGSDADGPPSAEVGGDTASTTAPGQPPPAAAVPGEYVVAPGDTLAAIADRMGVALEALVAANGIGNPNLIYRGQVLTIPRP